MRLETVSHRRTCGARCQVLIYIVKGDFWMKESTQSHSKVQNNNKDVPASLACHSGKNSTCEFWHREFQVRDTRHALLISSSKVLGSLGSASVELSGTTGATHLLTGGSLVSALISRETLVLILYIMVRFKREIYVCVTYLRRHV